MSFAITFAPVQSLRNYYALQMLNLEEEKLKYRFKMKLHLRWSDMDEMRHVNNAVYPLELTVGRGQVIAGWDEAITLMSKGSKMTVYIPSTLAYGAQRRSEDIVENSILVFDMELMDVK